MGRMSDLALEKQEEMSEQELDELEAEYAEYAEAETTLLDLDGNSHSGALFTVQEFKEMSEEGSLIDYDGHGDMVENGVVVTPREPGKFPEWVLPSQANELPENVTHILWYNK